MHHKYGSGKAIVSLQIASVNKQNGSLGQQRSYDTLVNLMIERNTTIKFKTLLSKVPYAYFICICIWIAFDGILKGNTRSFLVLVIGIPFVYQLKFENRTLNIILGSVLLLWSLWMMLAFITDVAKITNLNYDSWSFITSGVCMVFLNFLASLSILGKVTAASKNPISIA